MNSSVKAVSVKILDKEYRVSCKQGEEAEVLASAHNLDERMREIRLNGKIVGSERIAVMAALNLTHELLKQSDSQNGFSEAAEKRIQQLRNKVENALNQANQLEF